MVDLLSCLKSTNSPSIVPRNEAMPLKSSVSLMRIRPFCFHVCGLSGSILGGMVSIEMAYLLPSSLMVSSTPPFL